MRQENQRGRRREKSEENIPFLYFPDHTFLTPIVQGMEKREERGKRKGQGQ